ncbi:MAG: Transposase IS200-family protein [Actinobacteria bacterium]|nr:Transposase IS200-family protein [Actinomycetota bacterium]
MTPQLKPGACKISGKQSGLSRPSDRRGAPAWISCVWPHDGGPATNTYVHSRDGVGRASEPASRTPELCLGQPVGFVDVPAIRAFPGSVARVHEDDGHSRQCSFVNNETAELGECPRMQRGSLGPPSPDPFADALEVFQGDTSSGAFGLSHDALGNAMVDVSGESSLLPPALFEQALGALGSFRLEPAPKPPVAVAQPVQMAPGKDAPVGIGRDVDDAEVDADHVGHRGSAGLLNCAGCVQVPLPIPIEQIRLTPLTLQEFALVWPAGEGNHLTARDRPDRCSSVVGLVAQDSGVVGDCSQRLERALGVFGSLVSVGHLGNQEHDDLGREPGGLPYPVVGEPMEGIAAEGSMFPGYGAEFIGSGVRPTECCPKRSHLLRIRPELDLGDESCHAPSMRRGTDTLRAVLAAPRKTLVLP